jgi:cellulose synthase operon protein B
MVCMPTISKSSMRQFSTTLIMLTMISILSSSCKKEDSNTKPANASYSVSGVVRDRIGKPMKGIKIQSDTTILATTDSNGMWQIVNLSGVHVIQPLLKRASFEPKQVTVYAAKTGIAFQNLAYESAKFKVVYDWLSAQQLPNGLVRSSFSSPIISLYDNALAALTFIALEDYSKAEKVFDYFNGRIDSELKVGSGGFSQFRDVITFQPNNNRWLGDNAWMLIALNAYSLQKPTNPYGGLRAELSDWIIRQQNADGSLSGGTNPNGQTIGLITEGMLDAFNAVLGYENFHANLLGYLGRQRWDATERQFICVPDNGPYRYALDNFSWGYSCINGIPSSMLGKAQIFYTTKVATANGATISGYCFDTDKDAIWPEGTGQMAVAYQISGNNMEAEKIIKELEKFVVVSPTNSQFSGIPYASNRTTAWGRDPLWQGADTEPCTSSATWFIMALKVFNPFVAGRNKQIPARDVFWN